MQNENITTTLLINMVSMLEPAAYFTYLYIHMKLEMNVLIMLCML